MPFSALLFLVTQMNDFIRCPNASCKPNKVHVEGCTADCEVQLTNGTMSGQLGKSFNWDILGAAAGSGGNTNNLGYFNFSRNPEGLQMPDMRGYASAAVVYYSDGKLVEDNTDQYLLTW